MNTLENFVAQDSNPINNYQGTARSVEIARTNPYSHIGFYAILPVVLIFVLFFIFKKKNWNSIVARTSSALYTILLVIISTLVWNNIHSDSMGIGAFLTAVLLGFLTSLFTFIIGLFGWKRFKDIEIGFITILLANSFFALSVGGHSSFHVELQSIFSSFFSVFSIPIILVYIIRLLLEYKNTSNSKFLTTRLLILSIVAVAIFAGSVYFSAIVKNDNCRAETQSLHDNGFVGIPSPNCR